MTGLVARGDGKFWTLQQLWMGAGPLLIKVNSRKQCQRGWVGGSVVVSALAV